jgi:RimJ/RimL family protein N-acetyltransferase
MENPDFDIRFSELDDIAYLSSWLSLPGECDHFPFGLQEKEDALKNWLGFAKYKASLTGLFQNTPCAIGTLFLMPYLKVSHHCSFYVFVDPEKRRQGIGTAMVRNLLHLAKSRFRLESVQAELFLPSPLETILDKQGFTFVARQDDFFRIPQEDGGFIEKPRLVMEHYFHE